jgi:SAM-dependent methyltransferase
MTPESEAVHAAPRDPQYQGRKVSADAYEAGRPSYPTEAVQWLRQRLRVGPGSRVVDLGAGTGKLALLLAGSGAEVVAVEPLAHMRAKLAELAPSLDVRDGLAEEIPLGDGSVDAVFVAQAFHWFDADAALAEVHRVLVPGGGLGLIWNVRDNSVPWMAGVAALTAPLRGGSPSFDSTEWREAFARTMLFGPLEERVFDFAQPVNIESFLLRLRSNGYVAALSRRRQDALCRSVRDLLLSTPGLDPQAFVVPYRTHAYVSPRLPDRDQEGPAKRPSSHGS